MLALQRRLETVWLPDLESVPGMLVSCCLNRLKLPKSFSRVDTFSLSVEMIHRMSMSDVLRDVHPWFKRVR